MSLYDRLGPQTILTADRKLSVWPIIVSFTRWLDEKTTIQALAAKYDFDAAEIQEAEEYKQGLVTLISEEYAELVRIGMQPTRALRAARLNVQGLMQSILLARDLGQISLNEFREAFGLPPIGGA